MVVSDASIGAMSASLAQEQRVEANRVQASDVAELASEFSALLSTISQQRLDAERSTRLSALLGTFDELVRDMREASADIRRLLAD